MTPFDKKQMGLRIKKARESKGLTQDELAYQLNMNRASISSYEAGRAVPPSNILRDLADIFGVSADYLLGRDSEDGNLPSTDSIPGVGAAVKAERLTQHLTQQELGNSVGVSQSEISQFERDIVPIPEQIAEKIAGAFAMSFSELLEKYNLFDKIIHSHLQNNVADQLVLKESKSDSAQGESPQVETIAAHYDGDDWTAEELADIEKFKEFVRSKRSAKS